MWFIYGFAIVAGVLNAVQSGANASLNKALQQPFAAALTIVAVSFTTLLVSGLVSGQLAWPGSEKIAGVPWWAWFGGVFGATYVMSQLLVAERVGAAVYIGLKSRLPSSPPSPSIILVGSGLRSIRQPSGGSRALGLMLAGVALIAVF